MAEYYRQPEPIAHPPPQPDGQVEPRPEDMPEHAHEGTDINIRLLVRVIVAFAAFAIFTHVFLWFVHQFSEREIARKDTGFQSAVRSGARPVPPEPRLQGISAPVGPVRTDKDGNPLPREDYHRNPPRDDMEELKTRYSLQVHNYLPADPDMPAGRIPIERAMELALERQLFKVGTTQPTTRPGPPGAE